MSQDTKSTWRWWLANRSKLRVRVLESDFSLRDKIRRQNVFDNEIDFKVKFYFTFGWIKVTFRLFLIIKMRKTCFIDWISWVANSIIVWKAFKTGFGYIVWIFAFVDYLSLVLSRRFLRIFFLLDVRKPRKNPLLSMIETVFKSRAFQSCSKPTTLQ